MLYRVVLHYACYGIEGKDGIITKAPPIAKWMIGKKLIEIQKWLLKRKGIIQVVEKEK